MNRTGKISSTRQLTVLGLMCAITVILAYTPVGMIPLFATSATIAHVPTIITAILFGPVMGAAVGFVLGVVSIIRALTSPLSPLDPLFINPLVSVLPRLLISFGAYYAYKLVARVNTGAGIIVGAAVGSLTNTIGCLGMLYIIYAKELVEKLGIGAEQFVWAVFTTSGILEMLVVVVITLPVAAALKKTLSI